MDPEDGRAKRYPRAPDRVRVAYTLRKQVPGFLWQTVAAAEGRQALEFSLGGGFKPAGASASDGSGGGGGGGGGGSGGGGGGSKRKAPWAALEEAVGCLEEGERATFRFAASAARLPLKGSAAAGAVGALKDVADGDLVELDVSLHHVLRQKDVSRAKDLSVTKCKLATGKGFWVPRPRYRVTVSAAPAPKKASPKDGSKPPPHVASYTFVLSGKGEDACEPLACLVYTMTLREVSLLTAPRDRLCGRWPKGGPLSGGGEGASDSAEGGMPPADDDGCVSLWVRLDEMTRIEAYYEDDSVLKETLNADEDLEWLEKTFVETKGEQPMLEEDVRVTMAAGALDGDGKELFKQDRQLKFHVGDMPFAEDWVLLMLMTMYHGERAKVTAKGAKAAYLLRGLCEMRRAQGGCPIDADSAAAHVEKAGLTLQLTILNQQPPDPKDGVSGPQLLASAENLKERANALLNAGYVANAMRKYVRATWLMQDGKEKEDPAAPMTEVVGIGKGDEPRKTRFLDSQAKAVKALRVSLHLNLAAGALKLQENYGALAAAKVARQLEPEAVKPLYREATAHVALQDFTTARECLTQLLKIEPQNSAARKLFETVRKQHEKLKAAEKRTFTGMFSRAQREGPLYTKEDIERATQREKEKTQYAADRAEEKRRGVEMLDVEALSRLPEEYQQKELDKMNESMENEHRQHEIPDGLTKEAFDRLLQMRTDGVAEHKIQREIARLRREDMEATRKYMTRAEVERMGERQSAIERDRYKSDEVVAMREQELMDEYKEIKRRVERRIPLMEVEKRRSEQAMREASEVLDNPDAEEEDKARAMRKVLHDPFKDLDEFLTDGTPAAEPRPPDPSTPLPPTPPPHPRFPPPLARALAHLSRSRDGPSIRLRWPAGALAGEMHELNDLKSKTDTDPMAMNRLQGLLATATERRVERRIDELLEHEDDVLV